MQVSLRIVSFPLRHNEDIVVSDFDLLGDGGDRCTVAFVGLLQLGKESRDKLQNCPGDQVSLRIQGPLHNFLHVSMSNISSDKSHETINSICSKKLLFITTSSILAMSYVLPRQ